MPLRSILSYPIVQKPVWCWSDFAIGFVAHLATSCVSSGEFLASTELFQGSGFCIQWGTMTQVTEPGDGAFVWRLL